MTWRKTAGIFKAAGLITARQWGAKAGQLKAEQANTLGTKTEELMQQILKYNLADLKTVIIIILCSYKIQILYSGTPAE